MIKDMAVIAGECIKNPKRDSLWVPGHGYVCPESEEAKRQAVLEAAAHPIPAKEAKKHPPLSPQFKLVFLTAAFGTFFFLILCLIMAYFTNHESQPLLVRLIEGLFDLVKIGFGAVVGLLGGKRLQSEVDIKPMA